MEFCYKGNVIKLQGESILHSTPCKGRRLNKLATQGGVSEFYQLTSIEHTEHGALEELNVSQPVKEVLLQHLEVFQ